MDAKDGHQLKLGKVAPTFLSFDAMPAKITETLLKNYHAKLFPIISS